MLQWSHGKQQQQPPPLAKVLYAPQNSQQLVSVVLQICTKLDFRIRFQAETKCGFIFKDYCKTGTVSELYQILVSQYLDENSDTFNFQNYILKKSQLLKGFGSETGTRKIHKKKIIK